MPVEEDPVAKAKGLAAGAVGREHVQARIAQPFDVQVAREVQLRAGGGVEGVAGLAQKPPLLRLLPHSRPRRLRIFAIIAAFLLGAEQGRPGVLAGREDAEEAVGEDEGAAGVVATGVAEVAEVAHEVLVLGEAARAAVAAEGLGDHVGSAHVLDLVARQRRAVAERLAANRTAKLTNLCFSAAAASSTCASLRVVLNPIVLSARYLMIFLKLCSRDVA